MINPTIISSHPMLFTSTNFSERNNGMIKLTMCKWRLDGGTCLVYKKYSKALLWYNIAKTFQLPRS